MDLGDEFKRDIAKYRRIDDMNKKTDERRGD
jgi:hypothetical protein